MKKIKAKAMKILSLPRRNFSSCSPPVNQFAYNSLVRPRVEYVTAAWNPFEKQHITSLKNVQRGAVRLFCGDYS